MNIQEQSNLPLKNLISTQQVDACDLERLSNIALSQNLIDAAFEKNFYIMVIM